MSMLRNQATALIRHERIETTVPKAKELRPFVERIISIAKRGLAANDAAGKGLHARRLVLRDLQDREVVAKLFDTIAPRFEARPGGYTRILHMAPRPGDNAPMALMQLVERSAPEAVEAAPEDKKAKKADKPAAPSKEEKKAKSEAKKGREKAAKEAKASKAAAKKAAKKTPAVAAKKKKAAPKKKKSSK